jgi:hypothetical protein
VNQYKILQLEIRLIIARYGKRRVLEEIAVIEDVDMVAIERDIEQIEARVKKKKQRKKKSISELIEDAGLNDDVRVIVEKLAYRYDAKEFLPQLRDVKRFLETSDIPAGKIRSRLGALPKVIVVLARKSTAELEKLVVELQTSERGDLGIITDHILGRGRG